MPSDHMFHLACFSTRHYVKFQSRNPGIWSHTIPGLKNCPGSRDCNPYNHNCHTTKNVGPIMCSTDMVTWEYTLHFWSPLTDLTACIGLQQVEKRNSREVTGWTSFTWKMDNRNLCSLFNNSNHTMAETLRQLIHGNKICTSAALQQLISF